MSYFDDLWDANKDKINNELSNIGTTLITNSVNSLFKTGSKQPDKIQTTPQVVQAQAQKDNTMLWVAGGAAALLLILVIVKR